MIASTWRPMWPWAGQSRQQAASRYPVNDLEHLPLASLLLPHGDRPSSRCCCTRSDLLDGQMNA